MSLVYTELSSVAISRQDGFRIATVNTRLRNLVENDQTFFGSSVRPGVWERRWYNDVGNKSLYYKKGDAVWLNTEPASEFVAAHTADIDMYVQGCAQARYKYLALSAANDSAGISKLYRDIALGLGDFDKGIYYLGNLLDSIQIRISLSDDNDRLPTDNNYWTDFFDRSKDESYYRRQILDAAGPQLSAVYDKHLREYHLSALEQQLPKLGLNDLTEFYNRYLQANLANVSKRQKFVNHAQYQADMTGFDHVMLFGKRNLSDGQQCQWFRLWKSGLLEHGGIVKVSLSSHDCGINDESARLYTVNLSWDYSGKTAPAYDFPTAGVNGFYSHDSKIYTGSGDEVDYAMKLDALGRSRRYVVNITPVMSLTWGSTPSGGPYQTVYSERFTRFPGKDVTGMNNSSFTFLYSPGIDMYSYYVRGFTVNKTRYY